MDAIYTAASRSLAALEILVHYSVLPKDFVVTPVRIPDFLIYDFDSMICDFAKVAGYQDNPDLPILGAMAVFGGCWIRDQNTAVLSVPSVIIPAERNYILNPAHPQFSQIEFLASEPFSFDPRLKQSV